MASEKTADPNTSFTPLSLRVKFKVVLIDVPADTTEVFPTFSPLMVKVVSDPLFAKVRVLVVKLTEAKVRVPSTEASRSSM